MSEIEKQICPGFHLKIIKRLSERLVDFILDNQTEFAFLLHFTVKDYTNVSSDDGEMEKYVQALPETKFLFMQFHVTGSFSYKYEFSYQKLRFTPLIKYVDIADNLVLCISQFDMEQKIVFEISNHSETPAHFELTVLELSGIRTFNGRTLFIVEIDPKGKTNVCELYFDGVWSYKYSYTYSYADTAYDTASGFPLNFESSN